MFKQGKVTWGRAPLCPQKVFAKTHESRQDDGGRPPDWKGNTLLRIGVPVGTSSNHAFHLHMELSPLSPTLSVGHQRLPRARHRAQPHLAVADSGRSLLETCQGMDTTPVITCVRKSSF